MTPQPACGLRATAATRCRRIHGLRAALDAALAAGDWQALAAADQAVAAALPQLAAAAHGDSAEQTAWASLRRSHSAARLRCGGELQRLDERLAALRDHRQGWMAYANHGRAEEVAA